MSTLLTQPAILLLSVDETIERIFGPVAEFVANVVFFTVPIPIINVDFPLIVGWLVVCGVFFSFYLKFLGLRGVKHAIDLARASTIAPTLMGTSPTSRPCPRR